MKITILFSLLISILINPGTEKDNGNVSEIDALLRKSDIATVENPALALEYAVKADSLSRNLSDEERQLKCKKQLGNLMMQKGEGDMALQYYLEGLEIAEKGKHLKEAVKFLNNIGVAFQEKGELAKALEFHLRSLEMARSIDDVPGIAASSNNIGIVHYKSNNTGKALQYFKYSLRIKEGLQDTAGMKQSLNNIASIYLEESRYDSALLMYGKCLEFEKISKNRYQAGITENNIGQLHMMQGDFKEASLHFATGLNYVKSSGNHQALASLYDNTGMVNHYTKNYRDAVKYFDSCLYYAQVYNDTENERNAYLHLSELHSDLGNYKPAFNYYRKYQDLTARLSRESSYVNESEAVFIKQQKENEILKLEKEQETKKLQISILLSVIVILSVLAAGIIYTVRLRQKTRYEKTLAEEQRLRFAAVIEAQEQERKRIAGDLHDSIGQMLSVVKLNMSALEDAVTGGEEKKQFLSTVSMVDEACNDVRSISHNLMPAALIRSGFLSALRELVNRINRTDSIKISLSAGDFPERLAENLEINLFRIIQEFISNTVKHAKASEARIDLAREGENLMLEIADNGIGISRKAIEASSGIGWKNIFSRLSAINGKIEIGRGDAGGSIFRMVVPL